MSKGGGQGGLLSILVRVLEYASYRGITVTGVVRCVGLCTANHENDIYLLLPYRVTKAQRSCDASLMTSPSYDTFIKNHIAEYVSSSFAYSHGNADDTTSTTYDNDLPLVNNVIRLKSKCTIYVPNSIIVNIYGAHEGNTHCTTGTMTAC